MSAHGIVYLVGAGPGDPGLITVRGLRLLRQADVVVTDRLVSGKLLRQARTDAEIIFAGKAPGRHTIPQEEINQLLIDRARLGRIVVRLKGGDPFVFGRGFEEAAACCEAGVPCVVVPGVTSAIAAPGAAGIPVTHRNLARTMTIVTAKAGADTDAPPLNFQALAAADTLCVLMGRENLREICASLVDAGRDRETPAACIEWGTTRRQRVVSGTLATIASEADRARITAPIVTIIGETVRCATRAARGSTMPLAGRRIVVTRSRARSREMVRDLWLNGALPISWPLLRIEYPGATPAAREALSAIGSCDWVAFTSVHSVIGFFRLLHTCGLDGRALGASRIATVGPATADALRRRGFRSDLTPKPYAAEAMADALLRENPLPRTVFFPHGDVARPVLRERLTARGIDVRELVVYRNRNVPLPTDAAATMEDGVDAVTFYSPSAVERWAASGIPVTDAVVACLGPTTADAARLAGLPVHVVPDDGTTKSMVRALCKHFATTGVVS